MKDPATPTVLIVEDEVFVRIIAADLLTDSGFQVLEAANADEALALLAEHRDVAVLFTDVNMPGEMDGLALAQHVVASRPEIKVIVTSGRQWLQRSDLPDDGLFLPKPYRGAELAEMIHRQTRN